MEPKEEKPILRLMISKKNPKKNPVHHELITVADIFKCINEKNINKFMREFKQGMSVGIATRNLAISLAKGEGKEVGNEILSMPKFTWIED